MNLVKAGSATVILSMILSASAAPAASTLTILVKAHGQQAPDTVLVEAAPGSAAAEAEIVKVALINGRGEISLRVEKPDTWRLRASAPGFWSPEMTVAAPSQEPVELTLWPAVAVTAGVSTSENADPPDEVHLTLNQVPELPVGAPAQPENAKVRCSITESRLASCSVPAGQWHLRIKVAKYIPLYHWNLGLEESKAADLGEIVLKRGASLFGKVVTGDGWPCSPQTRVELKPLMNRNVPVPEKLAKEIENLTETVSINDWGYFQFDAVPPRTYQLTAVQPGFMPSTLPRISIGAGQHVEISEPLVLQRALQLAVFISPDEDFTGEPWTVRVISWSLLEERKNVAEGLAESGEWISPPLAAGPYAIEVSDPQGNRLAWQEIELTEAEQTAWIELSYVYVSGKIVTGDEPLAAHIGFAADFTETAAESDEEGRFEVMLPQPGQWLVRVRSEQDNIDCGGIEIDIEPGHTEELLIEVPDTKVHGEVVYQNGAPAPDARVELVDISGEAKWPLYNGRTGSDGRFELNGLRPAIYNVQAFRGRLQSGIEIVQVSETNTTPPFQLVLHDNWMLKGKVVSGSEPVPGAAIWALPFTAQGTYASSSISQRTSGIDGSFYLGLPDNCEIVRIITMAPGFTLQASTATRKEDETTESFFLRLATGGGSLRLAKVSQKGVVVMNGVPLDKGFLSQWAYLNGRLPSPDRDLIVPAMPAGAYGYCDLTIDEAMLVVAGVAVPTLDRCAEGYLSEGGTLALAAPKR